ncbi:MAG: hypothetical protein FD149_2352 [Rhodospirillaceae bacterium]|nr:MAG: hypothetical protein FD149_2352 [Rhodospirillaceae bacterium]
MPMNGSGATEVPANRRSARNDDTAGRVTKPVLRASQGRSFNAAPAIIAAGGGAVEEEGEGQALQRPVGDKKHGLRAPQRLGHRGQQGLVKFMGGMGREGREFPVGIFRHGEAEGLNEAAEDFPFHRDRNHRQPVTAQGQHGRLLLGNGEGASRASSGPSSPCAAATGTGCGLASSA